MQPLSGESMQGTPPVPDESNALSMQDSVIGGDIISSNANQHVNSSGPKTLQWINLSLVCVAIVITLTSIFSNSWMINEMEILGSTSESKMGLGDTTTIICDSDGDCETEEDDLSDQYDECKKDIEEWESSEYDLGEYPFKETCENIGDSAAAGMIGGIIISIGLVLLFVSGVLIILGLFGISIPFAKHSPIIGATFLFIGFALWRLLLPQFNGDYGWGAKLTTIAGFLACYAGISPVMDKFHTSNGLPTILSQEKIILLY